MCDIIINKGLVFRAFQYLCFEDLYRLELYELYADTRAYKHKISNNRLVCKLIAVLSPWFHSKYSNLDFSKSLFNVNDGFETNQGFH